jgi:hypothetical protein
LAKTPTDPMPASSHSLQKRDARATSAFPLMATTSKMRRHVSKMPTTDNRAALREFRRCTIYRTEQLRQNAEKGSALRRAFLCFNATVNIDGALILGTSATY